jgi:uncharacterized OB-fold protein
MAVDWRAWGRVERAGISVPEVSLRKQSPVPNDLDRPFYDACNEDRLVLQHCAACNRFQFPPRAMCPRCGNPGLTWRETRGRGRIVSRVVVYDSPVSTLIPDQPFNVAAISLEEEPELTMLSHLPGVAVDRVPIGAAVEVYFEETPATGQKVPEWRLVG